MSTTGSEKKKVTVKTLRDRKSAKDKIAMLTAYDFPTATILDEAGIDVILVGDSVGMVALGYETTLPVTMEEMLHHCRAVSRGAKRALLVGDMPFMSYQVSISEAVFNAGRFLKEAGMDAIKLEGGRQHSDTIKKIVDTGIPVMGHLGLTPQSVNSFGGFLAQGKNSADAQRILEDALILEDSGCFAIVLESIPARLADYITQKINIPTIGIGAGSGCDGQVLVSEDLLGLFNQFKPKFVKTYANLHDIILHSANDYIVDVKKNRFPAEEHTFSISDSEWQDFLNRIAQ
jgi:3-methyl-2-oxobutanoate hydroxymethyltransferase